jgi:hypothetical protein
MAEQTSNTSVDLTSSPPSRDQHVGTATFDNAPEKTIGREAKEQGSDPPDEPQDYEYLSGVRLFLVLVSLTLAVFLMLLDASIVATVSLGLSSIIHCMVPLGELLTRDRPFLRSPATSIP